MPLRLIAKALDGVALFCVHPFTGFRAAKSMGPTTRSLCERTGKTKSLNSAVVSYLAQDKRTFNAKQKFGPCVESRVCSWGRESVVFLSIGENVVIHLQNPQTRDKDNLWSSVNYAVLLSKRSWLVFAMMNFIIFLFLVGEFASWTQPAWIWWEGEWSQYAYCWKSRKRFKFAKCICLKGKSYFGLWWGNTF